jgi:hypothetical protein
MLSVILVTALAASPAVSTTSARYSANVEISVTDRGGMPIPSAHVSVRGLTDRGGITTAAGLLVLPDLPAGIYTLRAERAAYVPLELRFTVKGGEPVSVTAALTPVGAPLRKPLTPGLPKTNLDDGAIRHAPSGGSSVTGAMGSPRTLSIPDLAERHLIGHDTVHESPISCAGTAEAKLIQVREPLPTLVHADADEMLYVVAGDATLRIGEEDHRVSPGWFSVLPRGTTHAISRRGRNPVILLSVVTGQPCP